MPSELSWSTDYCHPTNWDQSFAPLSLPDMLAASAARRGNAAMLDFMGRRFSYTDAASGAARVARGLQRLGIGKGRRVGLFLPNVPHYVAAYYGALAAGATVVNFSPLYTARELEEQVEDSGTDTLFT
ncbi:MAG: AMP-binding protein, partial [Sphingopyxis sp.]